MRDLLKLLDTQARYTTANGLSIEVIITDVKQAWGKTRYQITPLAGTGTVWVEDLDIPETVDTIVSRPMRQLA